MKPAGSHSIERDKAILAHLPEVRRVAAHLYRGLPRWCEMDDLISEGVLGLMEALGAYAPERETRFATFARHRIRGAMLDSVRRNLWGGQSFLRQGRAERARMVGPWMEDRKGGPGRDLIEEARCPAPGPEERYHLARTRARVCAAVALLNAREQRVMALRYRDDLPFEQIATVLEVSTQRVWTIHAGALGKLRMEMRRTDSASRGRRVFGKKAMDATG